MHLLIVSIPVTACVKGEIRPKVDMARLNFVLHHWKVVRPSTTRVIGMFLASYSWLHGYKLWHVVILFIGLCCLSPMTGDHQTKEKPYRKSTYPGTSELFWAHLRGNLNRRRFLGDPYLPLWHACGAWQRSCCSLYTKIVLGSPSTPYTSPRCIFRVLHGPFR